jgi:hypothetical protein
MKMCKDFTLNFLTKELAVASRQCTVSYLIFTREFLIKSNVTVVPHPPNLSDLAPCEFFSVPLIEDKTERLPL